MTTLRWTSTTPKPPMTSMQKEMADPPLLPMEAEFTGRYRLAAWGAFLVVGLLFWTAFFAAVL